MEAPARGISQSRRLKRDQISASFQPCNARDDGLPAGPYASEDVFEADSDEFFHKRWICTGVDCGVPSQVTPPSSISQGSQILLRVHRHQNSLDDEYP
jgi:hypothetical protein